MMLDEHVNFGELLQLQKKLRRFTFESKMELLRKLSHVVEHTSLNKHRFELSLFRDYNPSTRQFYRKVIHPFEIAFLALMAIISGEWRGPLSPLDSYRDFRKIVNHYKNYVPPFIHRNDHKTLKSLQDTDEYRLVVQALFFTRLALQQFSYQEDLLTTLYRYCHLFEYESQTINMKTVFRDTFGITFRDFAKIASIIYVRSSTQPEPLTLQSITDCFQNSDHITDDDIVKAIDSLSMTREQAIEYYESLRSDDERMLIYDFNPLVLRPIVREMGLLFLPVPMLLFKAITKGSYHYLCSKHGMNFRAQFGKHVFEPYLHRILKWREQDYTIIPEFDYYYEGNQHHSPDFILISGNDAILIEAKATAPTVRLRATDQEEFWRQLRIACGKAIAQCVRKERHLREGVMQHEQIPARINRVFYLIVTLEEFYIPINSLVIDQIRNICQANGVDLPQEKDFHVLGIRSLERILEEEQRTLFEYLQCRENTSRSRRDFTYDDIIRQPTLSIEDLRSRRFFKYDIMQELIDDLFPHRQSQD